MNFDYYYGNQADQFSFIRIPRVLLVSPAFSALSIQSKLLYGVLLDRMSVSMRNGWFDENNRVYIIYQITEIQTDLGFSKKKSIDYLNELEQFGLVEKKRRGRGLPSVLYVKSFMTGTASDVRGADAGTSASEVQIPRGSQIDTSTPIQELRSTQIDTSRSTQIDTSRSTQIALQEVPESTLQEVPKSTLLKNYNNINYTNKSYTNSNLILSPEEAVIGEDEMDITALENMIRENVDYDSLEVMLPDDLELLNGIVDIMLEVLSNTSPRMAIASGTYPTGMVQDRYRRIGCDHIQYVISCMKSNTSSIANIKKYLMAALFNAPVTMDSYYNAAVQHDFPGLASKKIGD